MVVASLPAPLPEENPNRHTTFQMPILSGMLLGALLVVSINEVFRGAGNLHKLTSVMTTSYDGLKAVEDAPISPEFLPLENMRREMRETEDDEDEDEDDEDEDEDEDDEEDDGEQSELDLPPPPVDRVKIPVAGKDKSPLKETVSEKQPHQGKPPETPPASIEDGNNKVSANEQDTKPSLRKKEKENLEDKKQSDTTKRSDSSQEKRNMQEQTKQDTKKSADPNKPLNIILLYGDDWRHDSIGSAGTSFVHTPFLDSLAEEGIKFTHSCVTTSVCWISRATLYTGQYVSRHKSEYPQDAHWYSGWNQTLPYLLRENGYHVGHVGKWHFEWNELVYNTFHWSEPYYGDHWYNINGKKVHSTTRNERDAIKFLRERPTDKPFFLGVCFFAPHAVDHEEEQFFPQPQSMKLYENETVEVPVGGDDFGWKRLPYFFEDSNEARRRWKLRYDSDDKRQRMTKNYFRLISEIDESSSVIYRELKNQGILDNTLILFTTDNGMYMSEHGLAGKWYPHQESIRVPMIIRDPRIPPEKVGTINEDFTLNIDLASTILGAANIPQPDVMQGRDIADLYQPGDVGWRDEFFYEHPVHLHTTVIPASTALVRKKYKFMTWPDYGLEQLFDLEADPYELDDMINNTKLADLVKEMRIRHDELKEKAGQIGLM